MAKIEPANLLLKDKNGNTGLVKSLTNKDITTLKNVVTNVDYIKDFVNANGGSLPVQGDIHLTATDEEGNNGKTLLGTSNGILQWNNKNLVRSVNGVNADENGNVEITAGGLGIGDIGLAPLGIDETDNRRRYLNGQVILQSQFSKFTEKLKHAITLYPNLVTSEDNWQSAVALSPLGQCGKFVIDDEAGTIRLPKVVNVMGALDLSTIGQTVEAGLPNITGDFSESFAAYANGMVANGAFIAKSLNTQGIVSSNAKTYSQGRIGFDASRSSSIYGNSSTVQQEAIKYPYFIQVATSNNEDVQIDTQVRLNNPFSLFMPYWSPIELNNLSWLRSNKQWNNGSVYVSAYEFLLEKYNSGTEQTETISDVPVTYKLADNGMKIITDKSKYDELISASGSAWFFVLDTENTQFVLPYTNGFAQFGNEPGKFTEAGLPNITGGATAYEFTGFASPISNSEHFADSDGALKWKEISDAGISTSGKTLGCNQGSGIQNSAAITIDARSSNSIYGNSDTVQPNSVTGYLYFYIGEVEQDANIIATSGLAESVSRKADNDLSNVTAPAQAFKDMSVSWCMPDLTARISEPDSGFTAPLNGWFTFSMQSNYNRTISINGVGVAFSAGSASSHFAGFLFPLKQGDIVTTDDTRNSNFVFYPCLGA